MTPDDNDLRLLTVKELAATLNIQVWLVYAMAKSGEAPPHLMIGRTLRFPLAGVRQWIAEQVK